jgi:hypothetical protein
MRESGNFDPFQVMQRAFLPSFGMGPALRESATGFWTSQAKILASMQEYADGWFRRRQAGTEEALASARRICEAETPFDAAREYQKWAIGSFERVVQDGLACQQQLIEIGRFGAEPVAQVAEPVRAESEAAAASTAQTARQAARTARAA